MSGCGLSRIVSIKVQDAEPVYDLEIAGTHNFVADGVVVHNSNIEQQSLEFVSFTLMPWLVRFEKAIKRDLLTEEDRKLHTVKFNVYSLLRGDAASRATYYHNGILDGWLKRNEARAAESDLGIILNPVEGLDLPLMPLNMTDGSKTPEQVANPATQAKPDENETAKE